MKRLIAILVLLLALSAAGVLAAPVENGQPLDELTALAQYAPAETPLFAVIRTDDDYFAALDGLIEQVSAQLPPGMVPPLTVTDLLNEALFPGSEPDENFEAVFAPWLGDSIAVYLASFEAFFFGSESPIVVAADVADTDAAIAFIEEEAIIGWDGEPTHKRVDGEDGVIIYEPLEIWDPLFALTGDTLLVADEPLMRRVVLPLLAGDGLTLAGSDAFSGMMDAMPADGYNILAYINPQEPAEILMSLLPMALEPDMVPAELPDMVAALGQLGVGFTLVDGRALVVDIASTAQMESGSQPLDLSLLENVPANTPLVIESSGLGTFLGGALDALDALDVFLRETGILPLDLDGFMLDVGPGDLGTFIRFSVEGMTGISLEDALSALDGDMVSYLRLAAIDDDAPLALDNLRGISMSLLRTENPDGMSALLDTAARRAQNALSAATYADGMLTLPMNNFLDMPGMEALTISLEDDLLIAAPASEVEALLAGLDANLTGTDAYAFESALFLPDATALLYLDMGPLRDVAAGLIAAEGDAIPPQDAEMLLALLGLLDTSSITTAHGDGSQAIRLTLTLSES